MARKGTPKYWVLVAGGYADTRVDYMPADTKAEVNELVYRSRFYASEAVAHVFVGTRSPWAEIDAYPDFTVDMPRYGKYVWERA